MPDKTLNMTASTIGRDLLEALVQEVRLLPDVWPKLSKAKQDDVIERLRKRVIHSVQTAVHLIASDGRVTIVGELEQVTVKDGIKAVLQMSKNDPNRHALIDAQGKSVLVAVADAEDHMGDVAAVRGEEDQRAMDLGHEYNPDADGEGMEGVVDVESREVPQLTDGPLQAELDAAYEAGRKAAEAGDSMDAAPTDRHELVARWTQGWRDWHDQNDDPSASTGDGGAAPEGDEAGSDAKEPPDDLYDQAVKHVVSSQSASLSALQRHLRIGYNRAARLLETMELNGIVSAMQPDGSRQVLRNDEEATA
jgi:ribosome modulation factor